MRKLDETDFIDRAYAAHGASLKPEPLAKRGETMQRFFCQLTVGSLIAVASQFFGSLPVIAGAPSKLVIGYASISPRVVPLWVAQEQGYLVKYGVDAETIYVRGGTILVAGLASGDVQVGRTAGAAILSAVSGGHDF